MDIPSEENQYIEFKSEAVKAADLADEIVALCNSEGGEIWLGIEDDRSISGLSRSYEADVMNICRSACIPPVIPVYETLEIDGKSIARITVPKGKDKPYYTSLHKYFIRVGSTKRVASREELLRLFQASGAIHYDVVEIDRAKITDLDMSRISEYFSRYHISFQEEPEEGKYRLMKNTDIIGEQLIPTLSGLLVFGMSPERLLPQSGISFAHFAGTEITELLIDKKNITGPIPRQADDCLSAVKANILIGSAIIGARRVDHPHYPDKVFRELIVNACVHRNYSIQGSNIRVFLFNDRLEVISPGTLPNTVSIEKLSVGTSFSRNPTLMRFMENLGYVDKLGRGLPMVCQEAAKLGKAVRFYEDGHEFKVVLPLPVNPV